MRRLRGLMTATGAGWLLMGAAGLGGCEGGTSSETVGVSAGMVVETAGQDRIVGHTDPGNILGLYAADFLPYVNQGFAMTATADSTGGFAFAQLAPGRYRLLARRLADGKAALLAEIDVPGTATARAPLEATGSLSGTIDTSSSPAYPAIVYAPGTPFSVQADSLKHYLLTGMPAGTYTIVKTWRAINCVPGSVCGVPENRQDSAQVRIRPGESAAW